MLRCFLARAAAESEWRGVPDARGLAGAICSPHLKLFGACAPHVRRAKEKDKHGTLGGIRAVGSVLPKRSALPRVTTGAEEERNAVLSPAVRRLAYRGSSHIKKGVV